MLWNREDAEDATQEILVRVVTRLSQFDFRSQLKTWVYRVAVNYILDVKKSPVERLHLTFDAFAEDLAEGLSTDGPTDAERSLLIEEVKIGCTLGMLQCLDRPHRLAYVLGEILDCQGRRRLTPWRSPPTSFASAFSTHARPSCRSPHLLRPRVGHGRVRLRPSRAGGASCRKSSRPMPSTSPQPVVISGDARDRPASRGGEMGARGPPNQPSSCLVGRLRASSGPSTRRAA